STSRGQDGRDAADTRRGWQCTAGFQVTIAAVAKRKRRQLAAAESAPAQTRKAEHLPAAASAPPERSRIRLSKTEAHLAILIVVSIAAYGLTLRNGFVTDDNTQILMNSNVKAPKSLIDPFTGDVWSFANADSATMGISNYYRP